MKVVCKTDIGRSRDVNEDNCGEYKFENNWQLLIVADGMGGHNAGEVASSIAVKSITESIRENMEHNIDKDMVVHILRNAIIEANHSIYENSMNDSRCSGMGTTVTAAMVLNNDMLVGHVGDSRAYLLKNGNLRKVTNDHSLVAELLKNGTITEDEAKHHPQKNLITRALGAEDEVEVDIEKVYIDTDDIAFLCTDGLTNMLSDTEIEDILLNSDDINFAADKLVEKANALGGHDNITVIIAKITCSDGEVIQ